MNVFYVNLVDVQQQFVEINSIFKPTSSGVKKGTFKTLNQEARVEKCLIMLFNQTQAPIIGKKQPIKRAHNKLQTSLPSAAKLRK